MKARLHKLLSDLGETFWLLPATIVMAGILLAVGLVDLDHGGAVPQWLIDSPWLYSGGGTGARTLLGAVASSTIVATQSSAAGQITDASNPRARGGPQRAPRVAPFVHGLVLALGGYDEGR